jgi:acetoin utilization protein AcuC
VLRGLSWSRAAGRNPPEHWFTTLADTPRPGPLREEVKLIAIATLRDLVEGPRAVPSWMA